MRRFLLPTLCVLSACDVPRTTTKENPPAQKIEPAQAKPPRSVQRFVPLPEAPGSPIVYTVPRVFLALDTMTGQLCRTWDFTFPNPSDVQRSIEDLPTCEILYEAETGQP